MESLIEYVRPSFEEWGYLIVLSMGILENSAFVGAVIPGDVVLLLAGFYVQRSDLDLAPVVALAFIGAVVGDTIGYTIGRVAGRRIISRWGTRLVPEERLARVDRYFAEYGMWAVALGRLAPIVRTINTFAAGMAKMPFPQFLVAVTVAAAVWATVVPVLGFLFSESLEVVRSALGWVGVAVFLLFAGAVVFSYRRMLKRWDADTLRRG